MRPYYYDFSHVIEAAKHELEKHGRSVDVGRWQGMDISDNPHMITHELFDWSFACKISPNIGALRHQIQPNLPWADDHFDERVSRIPMNPGEQYKNWPFFKRQQENDRHRDESGQHSHTYMERIWTPPYRGIRYNFGNLDDVIDLLEREPLTRQAFLPIWFPEDTGVIHGGRVPCTLGYHFMVRNNELHIFYIIRSCDFLRHFRDDIYMACLLNHWVLDQLREREFKKNLPEEELYWNKVKPGKLSMHIFSLHIFEVEKHIFRKKG